VKCKETGEVVACVPINQEWVEEKTFIVNVRKVYVQPYRVKAKTSADAIRIVSSGDGNAEIMDNFLEYSHTLDPHTWTVEEMREAGQNR